MISYEKKLVLRFVYYLIQYVCLFLTLSLIFVDYFLILKGENYFLEVSLKKSRDNRFLLQFWVEFLCFVFYFCKKSYIPLKHSLIHKFEIEVILYLNVCEKRLNLAANSFRYSKRTTLAGKFF